MTIQLITPDGITVCEIESERLLPSGATHVHDGKTYIVHEQISTSQQPDGRIVALQRVVAATEKGSIPVQQLLE